jgi:transposase-like protein
MEKKVTERVIHKASEELKKKIVQEIEDGKNSIAGASTDYHIPKGTIRTWLWDYGNYRNKTTIIEVIMKDEKNKIKELQTALTDANMKVVLYDRLFELAGIEGEDLKKNFGASALEAVRKTLSLEECAASLDIQEEPITKKKN